MEFFNPNFFLSPNGDCGVLVMNRRLLRPLLVSVSLKSASWPKLPKALPELFLLPFWLRRTLPVRLLALTEAGL